MVEHLAADVRDRALADPRHQVKPRERADRQAEHQQQEQADGLIEQVRRLGHEPLVHQQANALPHGQGDAGRDDQGNQGTEGRPTIRREKTTGQAKRAALTSRKHQDLPCTR
ncbi:hypothetical protein D3C84_800210 [compost metagenome]